MLGKLLKYDFKFSMVQFFVMAAAMLFGAALLRVFNLANTGFAMALVIAITAMVVACIVLIYQHYNKSLFTGEGYLMLTLPVKRHKLLLSKLIASMVWFNFMLAAGILTTVVAAAGPGFFAFEWLTADLFLSVLMEVILFNLLAVNGILLLFLMATAANVSVRGRRIGGLWAGFFCAATVTLEILFGTYVLHPFMGDTGVALVAGRGLMMLGDIPQDATIYASVSFCMLIPVVAFSALIYLFTLHLLKRRVDLQ